MVGDAEDFPEGRPGRVEVGGTPVLLVRTPDGWHAMVEQCSHLGGPLADGELVERGGEACIVCPWHGSVFRLRDGEPVAGPATAPQPMVEVRTFGGQVQARVLPPEAAGTFGAGTFDTAAAARPGAS
jgi:nitrite reductase/ring-hydroxylating ferredoxin subunit